MWQGTDTQTGTQMTVTIIHFASAVPRAKCNKLYQIVTELKTVRTELICRLADK